MLYSANRKGWFISSENNPALTLDAPGIQLISEEDRASCLRADHHCFLQLKLGGWCIIGDWIGLGRFHSGRREGVFALCGAENNKMQQEGEGEELSNRVCNIQVR